MHKPLSPSPTTPTPHPAVTLEDSKPFANRLQQGATSRSDEQSTPPTKTPAKRGRKPGPLSRAAREAQRRLNHSIIEKARRTKINDALATLRELVPLHYGESTSPAFGPMDSDAEDDRTYEPPTANERGEGSGKRKRSEKEKEFKLEILVRTVAYMKDLVSRVGELERRPIIAQPIVSRCPSCGSNDGERSRQSRKRRYSMVEETKTTTRTHRSRKEGGGLAAETILNYDPRPPLQYRPDHTMLGGPLPSISSWLPETTLEDSPRSSSHGQSPTTMSYLPSPPSSAHGEAVRTLHPPPALCLAPLDFHSSDIASRVHQRTPEDENAAAWLIQMSTSSRYMDNRSRHPPASPTSSARPFSESAMRTGLRESNGHTSSVKYGQACVQTPAKLLGLSHLWPPEAVD